MEKLENKIRGAFGERNERNIKEYSVKLYLYLHKSTRAESEFSCQDLKSSNSQKYIRDIPPRGQLLSVSRKDSERLCMRWVRINVQPKTSVSERLHNTCGFSADAWSNY